MEFQHFLSKSPDAHCHAKSCTGSAGPCTTVHNFARPCNQVVLGHAWQCWPMHDRAPSCMTVQPGSARPCMVVPAYARPCISQARLCRLASVGPKQGSARPNGAENGNFDNRPRPKVEYCSTLHDRAPMVHDRAKFQNFYKFSFSPHFKGLDFLELKYLLDRILGAF
ncbi:hypothetical protein E3N88_23918 [Mikania micrantha]|uniref:Uncharacterized protein n=1 Tax=Mikania micrantha TaxID=192012 RepID=A0A5N6NGP5_9ASTR|nr:hypothetical protein E3N88_23918 [Mikania micrantha]